MKILGLNSAYHESSAALVVDGQVVMAIEEERLSRRKHGKEARVDNPDELPLKAIAACLEAAGGEVDRVAYALEPGRRRVGGDPYPLEPGNWGTEAGEALFEAALHRIPEHLGRPVEFLSHHLGHAASAFYPSPFEEAAVLVVDGIGEEATTWLGRGNGAELELLEEIPYPHSLGFVWERVAVYLGFSVYDAPKVMGLAAYGQADRAMPALDRLLRATDTGFSVDARLARFRSGDVQGLEELFGPRYQAGQSHLEPRFADLAAALQRRTEEIVLVLARRLHRLTGSPNLAYAGGVALNCVANARLEREGPFEALYIPGAAHDAGTAVGVALELAHRLGAARRMGPLTPFLGPAYECEQGTLTSDPAGEAARCLAESQLVGWFQGRLELGPRALGHRSLLADPRQKDLRAVLNDRIKHREPFRPFAAAVLEEHASDWFDLPVGRKGAVAARDLMLLAYSVRDERRSSIPAVVHHDGSCRIQTVSAGTDPLFHRLISEFYRLTGVPLVLNTSFNDSEPIVCTVEDAVRTYRRSGLDALFVGDRRL
ncbi:MAG: carbamoyltransferase [Candidatus Xenobia bacterium]